MRVRRGGSSPNRKIRKKNNKIKDGRIDSLKPNTLYLVHIKYDYTNGSREAVSSSLDNKVISSSNSGLSNEILNLDSPEQDQENEVQLQEKLDELQSKLEEFLDNSEEDNYEKVEDKAENTLLDEEVMTDIVNNNVINFKSQMCFVCMENHSLTYNMAYNFQTDKYISKDDPLYVSYVKSNIFLKNDDSLKFDKDSIFDASWEAEANHLCSQIIKFVNSTSPYNPLSKSAKTSDKSSLSDSASKPNQGNDGLDQNKFENSVFEEKIAHNSLSDKNYSPNRNDIRVIDAFSGIGGNLIPFINNFNYSLGVELNKKRVEICKDNILSYGVKNPYDLIHDDFFNFATEFLNNPKLFFEKLGKKYLYRKNSPFQFDWIHLSPPWGGVNYKGSSNYDIYKISTCFPNVSQLIELCSKLAPNITLYLPRSQSLSDLLKTCSRHDYRFILIDSYLIPPVYNKIRCCMIHLIKDYGMFKSNAKVKNVKKMGTKLLFAKIKERAKDDNYNVITINGYINELNIDNLISIGLSTVLNETSTNVYNKLRLLIASFNINTLINLINVSIQIYYSEGLVKMDGNKRTIGGIFFYLLKVYYNQLYKHIEKNNKK
ncbi:Trimethylguanosine synthase [Theileria parva strain Muguga]|uniref:Trimethylguanosine synthase n=1 Tax=Theileria parva strain Muguga TaxID=333668 RepID=UPI001C6178F8|nr:Trimethylguanosine synthase [Theileria parva strain Muguga]EAN33899.2 Trimethylguanosine synthase [Theileria parva strain Muguga]